MTESIAWSTREVYRHLTQYHRGDLLMLLNLHTNTRNRCWPSIETLAEEMDLSPTTIIKAKHWLIEVGAITLVPVDKREGKEQKLPIAQHVYQLTGFFVIDGNVTPYFSKDPSTIDYFQNLEYPDFGTKVIPAIEDKVDTESSDGSPTPPRAGTKKTDPKPKPTTPSASWERQWYMVMMGGRYMTVPVRGMPSENAHFTQGKTANSMTTAKSNGSMWVYMSSLNMLDYVVYKWRPTMNDDEIEATLKDRKLVWKGKQGNGTMLSKVSPANILHLYQNADEKGLEIYRSASWERLLASIIAEQSGATPEDEPAPQPEQTEPPATDEPKPKRTAAEMLAHAAAYMARIAETSQNPVPYTPSEAPDDDHIPF